MAKFKGEFRVESSRLKSWDYSTPGWYFVTICVKDNKNCFGAVDDYNVKLNNIGEIVELFWKEIPDHYNFVELDEFVVMPDHFHAIIILNEQSNVEVKHKKNINNVETGHAPSLRIKRTITLGNIIGSFKSAVTKNIYKNCHLNFSWQTRFYDRIIRNERELFNIRKYISQNPLKWELDKDSPSNCVFDK
ncbi:MAG: hypothetical protein JEY94_14005 [Melioribacteraceae bacterium]|nr:hypothetical protein [Melioribacteraceae bacterium]